jgi:hypothetical protein
MGICVASRKLLLNLASLAARAGGVVGGVVGGALMAGLVLWYARRRRAAARAAPPEPPAHASLAGANARLSIIPGVKERFALTEVVEASGSPYSARRRARTAFNSSDSPVRSRSPQKRGLA